MSTEPPQLDPLPWTFASTARAPHRVAEQVLAPAQHGGEIALMATPGALGIRVTGAAELDAALAEAVAHDGPAMVEVITDPNLV
jgi:hypothetical protein